MINGGIPFFAKGTEVTIEHISTGTGKDIYYGSNADSISIPLKYLEMKDTAIQFSEQILTVTDSNTLYLYPSYCADALYKKSRDHVISFDPETVLELTNDDEISPYDNSVWYQYGISQSFISNIGFSLYLMTG